MLKNYTADGLAGRQPGGEGFFVSEEPSQSVRALVYITRLQTRMGQDTQPLASKKRVADVDFSP
jgi:hypothetical protein